MMQLVPLTRIFHENKHLNKPRNITHTIFGLNVEPANITFAVPEDFRFFAGK